MRRSILNFAAAAALAVCSSSLSYAAVDEDSPDGTPSAGAMAFDLVVVRPLGLVATVLGAGLFVLQLPLSVIQGEPPSDPAKKLVVEPARFTFERPLGQMN